MDMEIVQCLGQIEERVHPRVRSEQWLWTPPATRVIKVNVDDSFLADFGKGNIRGVIRHFRETFGFSLERK